MTRPPAGCPRCLGKGAVTVHYHSGELFDVALCECAAGDLWRHRGEAFVRQHFGLTPAHQVTDLGQVEGEGSSAASRSDVSAAARTQGRKAKL